MKAWEKQESLEVLNYQIRACERCSLSVTRKHALTGEGDVDARIMFVALSPGWKEDSQIYNPSFEPETIEKYKKLRAFL